MNMKKNKGLDVGSRDKVWKCSQEPKRSLGEALDSPMHLPQRPFKAAHDSFRLRMFQEQHGFEPVVFMTKKRTRDNKSVMSEFKGGDLNKYTAKTYAIQNGNEVFGGELMNVCPLFLAQSQRNQKGN
ncbi:hypothetical protein ANCCEY_01733 [Ancylostoma ceylanicum]|uniref:Uncharacterized protein n=1 Tax=Ancylostoma ceylanicum TaxID=53326 RepID=A0A0D6M9S7_9BILA|nr:hypothetical protein ANCCEY_01733 [Ancylostoma ceylanicum]